MSILKEDLILILIVTFAGLTIGILVGIPIGKVNGRANMVKEAIKLGHAEWINDKDGAPQFKWKVIK